MIQVRTVKRTTYKGGTAIPAGVVLYAEPTTYPKFDRKHFRETGEYTWPQSAGWAVEYAGGSFLMDASAARPV